MGHVLLSVNDEGLIQSRVMVETASYANRIISAKLHLVMAEGGKDAAYIFVAYVLIWAIRGLQGALDVTMGTAHIIVVFV